MRTIKRNPKFSKLFLTFGLLCYLFILMSFSLPQEPTVDQVLDENAAIVTGKVIWNGHDLSRTTVQVYKDEKLQELYTSGILLKGMGKYELRLEPGTYYMVAFVDENRSGQFDAGDGMGIYGITDWNDRTQQKKAVTVGQKERLENVDIPVTAMMIQVDGKNRIASVNDAEVRQTRNFKLDLDRISTGISGQLLWSDHKITNAIVLAYTDLSWRYRAAQAKVDEDGKFTINVPPGKYYLLAIIDENGTNLFDAGDEFGIYGMDRLKGKFPKPVLVEPRKLTENVEITIAGRQDEDGKIISLQDGEEVQPPLGDENVKISGKVIWPEHPVDRSIIQVYDDQTLTKPIRQIPVDKNGGFSLELPAGDYYIIANVDADGDGKYSPGDGIGAYGATDITLGTPSKLTIEKGQTQDVKIFISAKYDASGQLQTIPDLRINAEELPFEGSGFSGKIIWEGQKFKEVILLISETPQFSDIQSTTSNPRQSNQVEHPNSIGEKVSEGKSPLSTAQAGAGAPVMVVPMEVKNDGSYAYPLNSGDYYVMAVVDINADHQAGIRDGVGVYGTRSPMTGKPQLVAVFPDRITPYIDIYIRAIYIDDQGGIAQIDDGNRLNIRQQYGEPEDIYQFTQFGRKIEEWWYWTKGIAFTFEAVGPGWKLKDSEKFKPKSQLPTNENDTKSEVQSASEKPNKNAPLNPEDITNAPPVKEALKTSLVNAVIYYTYDDVIWGLAPDGTQQPLSLGTCPTSASDGSKLSIVDIDGNVRIIEGDNPNGIIALSRSDMASDPAISPNGLYVAFVRKGIARSQIYIKHLITGDELPIPSTFRNFYTPAWNAKSDVIAYAASGSIENLDKPSDKTARNIYSFDQVQQRLDPISIGPEDDAEPAWSPVDHNTLVFSRAEDNHRQLWIIIFDEKGESTQRQLTRFGGQKPTWLPDGSGVVYENNGQLWTVDVDGENERPLLIRGKPVFGLDPYAR